MINHCASLSFTNFKSRKYSVIRLTSLNNYSVLPLAINAAIFFLEEVYDTLKCILKAGGFLIKEGDYH